MAVPKFAMENGALVATSLVKTQEGIGGVTAAGSRRTASRMSSSVGYAGSVSRLGSANLPDSRADSRAGSRATSRTSLVDATRPAAAGRRPPPTDFSFGPSLPPPPGAAPEPEADAAGAVGGAATTELLALAEREAPNMDEVFDYATYLGIDPTMVSSTLFPLAVPFSLLWSPLISCRRSV